MRRRIGAALTAISLAAFIAIVTVLVPAVSDVGEYGYRETYGDVIRHPWLIPVTLVTPPIKMLTAFLWVAHDVGPRAMTPKIKNFVQPKSWFVDFSTMTMN